MNPNKIYYIMTDRGDCEYVSAFVMKMLKAHASEFGRPWMD